MKPDSQTNACANCKHYVCIREEESWEMSHIFWYDIECSAKPQVSNLRQFPFSNTKCKQFESKV